MAFVATNPNPCGARVGDCVVRAISIATGDSWKDTYIGLAAEGFMLCDMPSSNAVWGQYLRRLGFRRHTVTDSCPDCYTIRDFCSEHPHGVYILATGVHAVAVIDGNYYDTWDSGAELPVYYWRKNDAE